MKKEVEKQGKFDREELDERWYGFFDGLVGKLQHRFYQFNEETGLSQKDIAERLGRKDATYISRCLAGQKNMTLKTIFELARAMDSRLDVEVTPLDHLPKANNQPQRDVAGEGVPTASNITTQVLTSNPHNEYEIATG
jgi:transcriptional regulator with XRE-family HTH domain